MKRSEKLFPLAMSLTAAASLGFMAYTMYEASQEPTDYVNARERIADINMELKKLPDQSEAALQLTSERATLHEDAVAPYLDHRQGAENVALAAFVVGVSSIALAGTSAGMNISAQSSDAFRHLTSSRSGS